MSKVRVASIIINNYNYGRFLKDAIDSALNQTYSNTEVIVVDDGSTDNSPEIILSFGDRITPVLRENGGQASAFNAGFLVSRGEVILFLDSDDILLPTAVEKALPFFQAPDVVKVHWPLWVVNENGRKTGQVKPGWWLPEGDLREVIVRDGPDSYITPPTTGNAWARWFLGRVLPMPEVEYRICADGYLFGLAPLFGCIRRIPEPQGVYRLHRQSNYSGLPFHEKLRHDLRLYDHRCAVMSQYCRDMGINVDPNVWRKNSWFFRLELATQEIAALIPARESFILVDEDQWGTDEVVASHRRIPFPERDGQYWGPPPDDETAIRELERLRQYGASFMVFGWPAFWWLDYYAGLHHHLRSEYRCVLENERVVVFALWR